MFGLPWRCCRPNWGCRGVRRGCMPSRAANRQAGQNKKAGGATNPNQPSRAYRNLAKHALNRFNGSIAVNDVRVNRKRNRRISMAKPLAHFGYR